MRLNELSETIWAAYQSGSPDVKKQTFHQQDIAQMVKMAAGNAFRELYYASKQESGYREPDYFFSSPLLQVKRYELPEPNIIGLRRADMSADDLYRLPRNSHFVNVYPYSEKSCGNEEVGEITQVAPGEENFYINDPNFKWVKFYVVKGRGLNTYNIPICVTHIEVEATFDDEEADISLDVAWTVASSVLARVLQTNDATGETQKRLKRELEKKEGLK